MNYRWFAAKFWVEIIGIILSLCAAITAAVLSSSAERAEKVAIGIFSAGIFFAILRARFDVLKELSDHKNGIKLITESIDLYSKITDAISSPELPGLQKRAKREIDQAFKKIQALAEGRVILDTAESMFYQAALIRSAKSEIFAIHTVKDKRDLLKWIKIDGEFNVLKWAYMGAKRRLKPSSMTRVFVVAGELAAEKECMELLSQVKSLSEHQLGFKSSIVLCEMADLDQQTYLPLLLVDRSGLVIVRIESGDVREFKIVAYEGKGLETMLAQDDFAAWIDLKSAPDMSTECFVADLTAESTPVANQPG